MSPLVEQIEALLDLNAKGAVSHPVPGLAVELLTKAAQALRTPLSALPGEAEVVAWRVKDYADGWILLHTEVAAKVEAENGNLIEPLVTLAALQAMQARAEKAERDADGMRSELSGVSSAIKSVRWMDPPDGGSVSLGEQVSRIRTDLEAAEARAERAERERDRAKMQAKACSYRIRYQREQLRRLQPKDRLERPKWLANFSIGQHINKLHSLRRGEAARAEAAEARALAAERERDALREALKPSGETKAEYIGEFTIAVERYVNSDEEVDDEGEGAMDPYEHVTVPWTTIKEIMAAISKRAARTALTGGSNG